MATVWGEPLSAADLAAGAAGPAIARLTASIGTAPALPSAAAVTPVS